jgi:hypothetical protein
MTSTSSLSRVEMDTWQSSAHQPLWSHPLDMPRHVLVHARAVATQQGPGRQETKSNTGPAAHLLIRAEDGLGCGIGTG